MGETKRERERDRENQEKEKVNNIKPSGGLLDFRGLAECNESEVLPCP